MNIKQLKPAAELAQAFGVKCLAYGPPGSGKTPLIKTAPRPVLCVVEPGMLSMRDAHNVPAWEAYTPKAIDEFAAWLFGSAESRQFNTVGIDSVSQMAEIILTEELARNKDGRKAYGEMNEVIIKLVKAFRDIPKKNVILICQQAKVQDSEGRILYSASMPGKTLSPALPFLFDLVACLRVRKDENGEYKRAFQFEPDEIYDCKQRGGKVNAFEPADWSIIFNKIKGN